MGPLVRPCGSDVTIRTSNDLMRWAESAAAEKGHKLTAWVPQTFHAGTKWEVLIHQTHCSECGLGQQVLRPVETGEWTEVGRTARERCIRRGENNG